MHKDALKDAVGDYCREALSLLTSFEAPRDIDERYGYTEHGSFGLLETETILWDLLVHEQHAAMQDLESYAPAVTALTQNDAINRHLGRSVGLAHSRQGFTADTCLDALVTELLTRQGGTDFDDDLCDILISELLTFAEQDTIEIRTVALLENFGSDEARVDLGAGYAIEMLSESEHSDVFDMLAYSLATFDAHQVFGNKHAFVHVGKHNKAIVAESDPQQESDRTVVETFHKLSTALSLFMATRLRYHAVSMQSVGWTPVGCEFHPSRSSKISLGGRERVFTADQLSEFTSFWIDFRNLGSDLGIGIRKFDQTLERVVGGGPEDQLLDLVILLDSTLLRGGGSAYQLAVRGANLLKPESAPEATYELLRAAYKQRNGIVHEGTGSNPIPVGQQELSPIEFLARLGQTCRDILVRLIQSEANGIPLARVLTDLDRAAFSG